MAKLTFHLNGRPMSQVCCAGLGCFLAYSGAGKYKNNPASTSIVNEGAIPKGIYYICDRESGGYLGWFTDSFKDIWNQTHRNDWFALYRADGKIDDVTGLTASGAVRSVYIQRGVQG